MGRPQKIIPNPEKKKSSDLHPSLKLSTFYIYKLNCQINVVLGVGMSD